MLLGSIIFLCLSGCLLGPNYKRPPLNIPQAFHFEPKFVAETANLPWWEQFNDPVLNELIAEALANNKDVKIAAANIMQAAGILMTTRSALFPQFNYTITATRALFSKNLALPEPNPNPFNTFQVLAGVNWEIDLWGRIRRLSESARAKLFESNEARYGVILSLVAELSTSYIQLRALDEQLIISKRTLKTYKKAMDLFELQYRHGQVSLIAVEQTRSQYETAAAKIPQLEQEIVKTQNAISVLLSRNPCPIPRGRSLATLSMPQVPAGLPAQLLHRRPDIRQAEANLMAANAQIGATLALYFPTITLTGNYGQASKSLATLFKGSSNTWSLGTSLIGPIFTWGNISGQVLQAKGETKAACFAYQQTIIKAFADVENALVSWNKLQKQYLAQKKRVQAYKSYTNLAWLKYNGGYSPYLEVLFAQTQLFPAELEAVQTKAAIFISLINIYKATGGGWIIRANKLTCVCATPGCKPKC
jgi:multidrug efflux system outer membrane protein